MTPRENQASVGRKRHFIRYIILVAVLVAAVATIVLNRAWLYDLIRGNMYQPSSEMSQIRENLKLTDRGNFLFNATQPSLSDQDEFNVHCRAQGEETAILGCYTEGNIYVYNIKSDELAGLTEVTAAHELLHAVWERMSAVERENLVPALEQVYMANQDRLASEINQYDGTLQQEELYVRVGTEIKSLPAGLEKHYGEIFTNQDAVVDYYDGYIAVFRQIETEMDNLMGEIEATGEEIDRLKDEYERRASQLEADIVSFNSCAAVEGCFKSEEEFASRRNNLVTEQGVLTEMYTEIGELIDRYNARVVRYNEDVTRTKKLNNMINSSKKSDDLL